MKSLALTILLIVNLTVFSQEVQKKKTVVLDYYFNHEFKKAKDGTMQRFHYMWEDSANSGFSILGTSFSKNGFALESLDEAPTLEKLNGKQVYIIVDADNEKETPSPHYILQEHIDVINKWVNKGGILVVFANDSLNVEFEHLNHLTETFGIHLNQDIKSKVYKDNFDMAAFYLQPTNPIFKTAKKVYLKEVTSLSLSKTARPVITHQTEGYVVAALAKVGKGYVFVVGDPWLYNEYTNGRLVSELGWDNDKAADDLTKWLFKHSID